MACHVGCLMAYETMLESGHPAKSISVNFIYPVEYYCVRHAPCLSKLVAGFLDLLASNFRYFSIINRN